VHNLIPTGSPTPIYQVNFCGQPCAAPSAPGRAGRDAAPLPVGAQHHGRREVVAPDRASAPRPRAADAAGAAGRRRRRRRRRAGVLGGEQPARARALLLAGEQRGRARQVRGQLAAGRGRPRRLRPRVRRQARRYRGQGGRGRVHRAPRHSRARHQPHQKGQSLFLLVALILPTRAI